MDLFEGIFLRILPYGKSSLLYCHIWENMFFFWFQASYYANLKQQQEQQSQQQEQVLVFFVERL